MPQTNSKPRRAKQANTRKSTTKKTSSSKLPWFVAGFLCGVAVTYYFSVYEGDAGTVKQVKQAEAPQADTKPRFDFYTLLRESEVIVSDTDEPALELPQALDQKEQEEAEAEQQQPTEVYVLQVGSFKNPKDADSLRAGLLLLNLHASIEKVSPKPNETWHRVLVGPLSTRAEVSQAREKLSSNKIDSLLLKRKR